MIAKKLTLGAFEAGWLAAAMWANRSDLITDIDSPAYESERNKCIAPLEAVQVEPASTKPLTDEQDRALCEAVCNTATEAYFMARPQLDSDVNRRIFHAGHRSALVEHAAAHNIKEQP